MDLLKIYTICTHNTTSVGPYHVYVTMDLHGFSICLKHMVSGMRSRNNWRALNDLQLKRISDALGGQS